MRGSGSDVKRVNETSGFVLWFGVDASIELGRLTSVLKWDGVWHAVRSAAAVSSPPLPSLFVSLSLSLRCCGATF